MHLKHGLGSRRKPPFLFIFFVPFCLAEIPISSLPKSNQPSAWASNQALKSQSTRMSALDQQPLFPPVRPNSQASQQCFPPPQMSNQPTISTPIITPASMPPPTPLVHGPQALPGTPIEFPLLNEAQNPPMGQIHHNSPAQMVGASTRNPDWSMTTVSQTVPTPSPISKPTMPPIPLQPGPIFKTDLQVRKNLSC